MSEISSTDEITAAEISPESVETEQLPEEKPEREEEESESLPLDQIFGILKNQRRRYVLEYLRDADGQISLSEVAEQIAAWENQKEVRQISSSERKRVYVGLYQCHLPKMDDANIVSFNKPRGTIEVGENAESVYDYIDSADRPAGHPQHTYSALLSLAGAVVLGMSLLFRPMTAVPVVDIAVSILIVSFLGYSLVSFRWSRASERRNDDSNDG